MISTAGKVSKYGLFYGPYISVFNLNTKKKERKKLRIWTLFTQCKGLFKVHRIDTSWVIKLHVLNLKLPKFQNWGICVWADSFTLFFREIGAFRWSFVLISQAALELYKKLCFRSEEWEFDPVSWTFEGRVKRNMNCQNCWGFRGSFKILLIKLSKSERIN